MINLVAGRKRKMAEFEPYNLRGNTVPVEGKWYNQEDEVLDTPWFKLDFLFSYLFKNTEMEKLYEDENWIFLHDVVKEVSGKELDYIVPLDRKFEKYHRTKFGDLYHMATGESQEIDEIFQNKDVEKLKELIFSTKYEIELTRG